MISPSTGSATTRVASKPAQSVPIVIRLRRYHRWVSTAAMALVLWVSITGVALAIDVWLSGRMPEAGEPAGSSISAAAAPGWMETAVAASSSRFAQGRLTGLSISLRIADNGRPRARMIATQGPGKREEMDVDAASGTVIARHALPAPKRPAPWRSAIHRTLEDLHRGTIIGLPGQLLSLLAGLSFLFLTISGSWVYVDMWRKRRRANRPGLFWTR